MGVVDDAPSMKMRAKKSGAPKKASPAETFRTLVTVTVTSTVAARAREAASVATSASITSTATRQAEGGEGASR